MNKIHFIGIGGIGVSGLASIYLSKGLKVSGSDLTQSAVTDDLKGKGAKVFIGHNEKNLRNPNKVIYSPAIPETNPELKKAKELGIKCLSYPEALGELTKDYFTIAVAGTHGKSSTASMVAQILIKAGLDPTFVIGTKPGSRVGKSKYLVIEADEYKKSFLNYHPDLAVVTNIEADHLDYFKDLEEIKSVFKEFKSQAKKVLNWKEEDIKLQVPGEHNRKNASVALAVARELGIDDKVSKEALFEYRGVWRRFEIKGELNGALIVDDYAHHPTEVKATIEGAKEGYPDKEIVAVFQPHQYLRLAKLFDEFSNSFGSADKVVITDVFSVAGREEGVKKTGEDLAKAIPGSEFVSFPDLREFVKKITKPGRVILMLGAGDIYKVTEEIL